MGIARWGLVAFELEVWVLELRDLGLVAFGLEAWVLELRAGGSGLWARGSLFGSLSVGFGWLAAWPRSASVLRDVLTTLRKVNSDGLVG